MSTSRADPATLGLSAGLVGRLASWQQWSESMVNIADPGDSRAVGAEEDAAFAAEGVCWRRVLRKNYHMRWFGATTTAAPTSPGRTEQGPEVRPSTATDRDEDGQQLPGADSRPSSRMPTDRSRRSVQNSDGSSPRR